MASILSKARLNLLTLFLPEEFYVCKTLCHALDLAIPFLAAALTKQKIDCAGLHGKTRSAPPSVAPALEAALLHNGLAGQTQVHLYRVLDFGQTSDPEPHFRYREIQMLVEGLEASGPQKENPRDLIHHHGRYTLLQALLLREFLSRPQTLYELAEMRIDKNISPFLLRRVQAIDRVLAAAPPALLIGQEREAIYEQWCGWPFVSLLGEHQLRKMREG